MTLRDNPDRRIAERYPLRVEQRVAFSDMDSFRHVNNVAIARWFEEGRAAMNIQAFGKDAVVDPPAAAPILIASVAIDYLRQSHYPGKVMIASAVWVVGRSSWTVAQAGFQDGVCFAVSESVMVKASDGKSIALTERESQALRPMLFNV